MSGIRAKYIPRIDLHDPVELKEAIPLRTPYVIYIDPCDTCNFRCKFCPTGNLDLMRKTPGRGHGPMSMTLYKEIIDSLSEFKDPIRVIRLYKEGEPLLPPLCRNGALCQGIPEGIARRHYYQWRFADTRAESGNHQCWT